MNRRYVVLSLFVGLAIGIALALLAPRFLGEYVPESIRGDTAGVEGVVTAKREMSDRLLLTLDTPQGAVLATFTERVPEITLLVDEGDSVTVGLTRYEPFVTDPSLQSVRKVRPAAAGDRERMREREADPEPLREPEDTAARDTLERTREDTGAARDTL